MLRYNKMIKKEIKEVILFILIGIVVVMSLLGLNYYEHHYTKDATVISIQEEEITVKDKQGYVWSFYGEGYEISQEIEIVLFDNITMSIYDDKIVRVKR